MPNRMELPQQPQGTPDEKLEKMYRYLYQMAMSLNDNLAEIGGTELTDADMAVMKDVLKTESTENTGGGTTHEVETLKSMIIKTAAFVKTAIDQYNIRLIGSVQAEGTLGKYVRHTGLDVAINPEGIEQRFTFEEVVQGLQEYKIKAKNYIYSGLLRTVDGIPVYGVAVGKDIVTFSQDGTETYTDGNKVAEFTADELSFYQGGNKVASYKAGRISFYAGTDEIFYIASGKIYAAADLELTAGNKLVIRAGTNSKWEYSNAGMEYENTNDPIKLQVGRYADRTALAAGIFTRYASGLGEIILIPVCEEDDTQSPTGFWEGEIHIGMVDEPNDGEASGKYAYIAPGSGTNARIGKEGLPYQYGYIKTLRGFLNNGNGFVGIAPDPSPENVNQKVQFTAYTDNNVKYLLMSPGTDVGYFGINGKNGSGTDVGYIYNFKTIHSEWFDGKVKNRATPQTIDCNSIIQPGTYYFDWTNAHNRPHYLYNGGIYPLIVIRYSDNYLMQIAMVANYLFTRGRYNGTWSNWYAYEGTMIGTDP